MATATQSTTPAVFMPSLATALASATSLTCKIIDAKTLKYKYTESFTESGIGIALGSLRPSGKPQGAGRLGFKVHRSLLIRLTTECLRDPAGRSEQALAIHWAKEDIILDTLTLFTDASLVLPVTPDRIVEAQFDGVEAIDQGRYSSFLSFDIEYPLPLTVTCQSRFL